ncbi:hypothetical protein M433DRAFT_73173 [Acidomyces richmondensis BFW]|nr:MAG: hypothetical protein FE78DRAFT_146058 [Acidomyces sp. 'richmondensis']KYG42740.1 hypothetical protein M433DRAFT_73173 [Acidomyces richmondensis BFW]
MDAKHLQDQGKQLVKAAEGGDPPATLLTLLQPLQKFTATEDLLRQSKIGVAVNKLRQHKDAKVASIASQLINKWKSDVSLDKRKKAGGSPAPGGANKAAVNGSPVTSSSASGKSNVGGDGASMGTSSKRKSTVPPAQRTAKLDNVECKGLTGNAVRDGCVEITYNGLAYLSEESPEDVLAVARTVEEAAFASFQHDASGPYKQKMRSLFMNLKMKENADLRRDVFSGRIRPERFVSMTSAELKSAEQRRKDAELEKENMSKAMTAEVQKAVSTTMTCGKCKQKRVSYTQAQTRSADEPMTTFCECENCGHKWKFS